MVDGGAGWLEDFFGEGKPVGASELLPQARVFYFYVFVRGGVFLCVFCFFVFCISMFLRPRHKSGISRRCPGWPLTVKTHCFAHIQEKGSGISPAEVARQRIQTKKKK